ncbi:hypothetical protein [Actinophytocola oryzae]|uniref:Uncharacterized protein n=1 Tax=Actinophytocola oryzae TaxID=502181 RepID=A0A4R7UX62_9PSEU|nr:hypothetical protein [Actinophytocola oryzae]TDV40677.1 hypothetical protein CLV71_12266 [Actinophytocola oryzae]
MASWNHDGTQDPVPPPLMSDPLSGLVTGGKYDGEMVRVRVIEPAAPDVEAVRVAMESVLDENSELRIDVPGPPLPPTETSGKPLPPPETTGKPLAQPTVKIPAPTPPTGIPVSRLGGAPLEIPAPRRSRPPRKRWSPGLAAVGLLLLVMAVLVLVMLASLIDTISSIFS